MTGIRPAAPWKGLDTSRPPAFLGYEQTERMISALLDRAARWRPDTVVAIARGGLVPATMAATTLALPLAGIAYSRLSDSARWLGSPPSGERILLVDDGCSTGRTMAGVRAALLGEGRACMTLAVVHDPDCTGYVPDLSHPMRELWRFPWERGEATPAGRAARAGEDEARELSAEAPFVGVDLDIALRRGGADPLAGIPLFAPDRAVIVSGASEHDRPEAKASLARWGYGDLHVEWAPNSAHHDPGAVARHKARVATRWGCTHFIEADPAQAIMLAAAAPHLVVSWWSAADATAYVVGAAATPADRRTTIRS